MSVALLARAERSKLTAALARDPERISPPAAAGASIASRGGLDRGAAVRLTLGLWALSAASFTLVVAVGGSLSALMFGRVVLTTLAGIVICAGVFGAFVTLAGLPTLHRRAALAVVVTAAGSLQAIIGGMLVGGLSSSAAPYAWNDPANLGLNAMICFWLFGLYASALELLALRSAAVEQARFIADHERRLGVTRDLARDAQVRLLRFQLDPDFIFNVLNNISSLVVTGNVVGAERAIARLCRFLRAAVLTGDGEMISLWRELSTVEAYLDIEATRFSERPTISIHCPTDLHTVLVPALILQPVAEHVVMRARHTPVEPTWIEIRVVGGEEAVLVTMATSGTDSDRGWSSANGDFDAVRRRLDALYGDKAVLHTNVDTDAFRVTLSLSRSAFLMRGAG